MAKQQQGPEAAKSLKPSKKKGVNDSVQGVESGTQGPSGRALHFPIVGIGASAGGLEALKELFENMPADTGMAFVIVTHQDPAHKSMLPELLGKVTEMPVVEAMDGTKVEPNHTYIAPPQGHLAIMNGTLHHMEATMKKARRLGIDYFLRSLAKDQKEQAICIILSGMSTDGTVGLKAIKSEAGMAMVQQPRSAKYAGMPSSAVATGLADYVLPLAEMPKQLVGYAMSPVLQGASGTEEMPVVPAESIQKIFLLLRDRTGHDFSAYKSNTLRRRIERRMSVHQINKPSQFVRYLEENPEEIDVLFKELLITVTNFFRDPEAWEAIVPPLTKLVKSRSDDYSLRAWVPGCATGEEAYSLAVVLQECMDKAKRHLNVTIFGTDLDAEAIDTARTGQYPDGIGIDVSPKRLERFFTKEENTYSVRKELREMVIFAPQNMISDPPFTKLDILCCRNLLIYLNGDLQKKLLPTFHYVLKPGGLLLLGPSETIGSHGDLFEPIDMRWKIFRRKEGATTLHGLPMIHIPSRAVGKGKPPLGTSARSDKAVQISTVIERWLLARFAPAAVVVNDRGDIFYVHGIIGTYLEPSHGKSGNNNVLEKAREGLKSELAAAIRQCLTKDRDVVREDIRVNIPGEFLHTGLAVSRLRDPETVRGLLLVTFHPKPQGTKGFPDKGLAIPNNAGNGARILQLEQELQYMKEEHQKTVEELESSYEDLQSTNEELQSTNEELETSKEEMQSMNEELTTVNAELLMKVTDLSQANDDMQNLLNSTDLGTVFLDSDLNIKRFTEHAKEIVKLRQSDVGRPIADLASDLKNGELVAYCRKVLKTLVVHESEVHTQNGDCYLMRILPYRTVENMIDGVVITFINIRQLKEAEHAGKLRTFFESIVETVRQPLLVLDDECRIQSANRCFLETFHIPAKQVVGSLLWGIGDGEWNIPTLRKLLEGILSRNTTFENFKMEHEFPSAGLKTLILNARRLEQPALPGMILLAMEDVTDKHRQ